MDAIVNIREIPVGSFVEVWTSDMNVLTCQVAEVLLGDNVRALILHQSYDFGQYDTGSIVTFPLSLVRGIRCTWTSLRQFGFTDSDEKGWKLVYWFGTDMKLLYRYDNKKQYASFRFKSTFRKGYVSISCVEFHRLQNIMRFLTGGELEFEYKI